MDKIVLFAGTVEGRLICEALKNQPLDVTVCVATEYGETLIEEAENIHVQVGRKDENQMAELFREFSPALVIDATHPYAAAATETIRSACAQTGMEYLRLLREEDHQETDGCIFVENTDAAVDYLNQTEGPVLLTTGSKELPKYTAVRDFASRLYPRILPMPKMVAQAAELGFGSKNLICMQGPFSEEMNAAILKMTGARYLVTKDTGAAGGFSEKLRAARACGTQVIVVERPLSEEGLSLSECLAVLRERFSLTEQKQVTVLGVGVGSFGEMTLDAEQACREADCIIGAKRVTDSLERFGKPVLHSFIPADIAEKVKQFDGKKFVIAMSGDTGFFSGTKKLLPFLAEYQTKVLPGICSLIYFCSRLGTSWDDALLTSTHGRSCNFLAKIRKNPKVLLLTGGDIDAAALIEALCENGLSDVKISVGQNLSYENEAIVSGTAGELNGQEFAPLAVVLAENPSAEQAVITGGRPDDDFIRAEVPMTKQEVRAVTLAKLMLTKNAVCWDVGAGTGSVSLEMADFAEDGRVYAIEQKDIACELIEQNKKHLGIANVQVVPGVAPDALAELPAPTHVFIGGSSGNMRTIIQCVLDKNPAARIVLNTVTVESLAEAVSCMKELPVHDVEFAEIAAARGRKLGRSHLMTAQNPVYIVSCTGGSTHE